MIKFTRKENVQYKTTALKLKLITLYKGKRGEGHVRPLKLRITKNL